MFKRSCEIDVASRVDHAQQFCYLHFQVFSSAMNHMCVGIRAALKFNANELYRLPQVTRVQTNKQVYVTENVRYIYIDVLFYDVSTSRWGNDAIPPLQPPPSHLEPLGHTRVRSRSTSTPHTQPQPHHSPEPLTRSTQRASI